MDLTKEYQEIVEQLLTASRDKRVNWKEAAREQEFFVSLSQFTVALYEYTDTEDGSAGVAIKLVGQNGETIDRVFVDESEDGYGKLSELCALARRKARKVDEALNQLRAELSKVEGVVGADPEAKSDGIPF
jgi:hypothetical protein